MAMDDLILAATEENWKYVDDRIPKVCDNPKIQDRAVDLLDNENPNLRDLGASIIEKAEIEPNKFFRIMPKLGAQLDDEHPPAKYRAAFALANHMTGKYDTQVRRILIEARNDKDVGEIARGYLKRLSE
jgi:hypothetical protein